MTDVTFFGSVNADSIDDVLVDIILTRTVIVVIRTIPRVVIIHRMIDLSSPSIDDPHLIADDVIPDCIECIVYSVADMLAGYDKLKKLKK